MNEEIKKSVKKVFTDYLEKKNLSKTNERFAILEEVYSLNEHFDVEHFYKHMQNKNLLKKHFDCFQLQFYTLFFDRLPF